MREKTDLELPLSEPRVRESAEERERVKAELEEPELEEMKHKLIEQMKKYNEQNTNQKIS